MVTVYRVRSLSQDDARRPALWSALGAPQPKAILVQQLQAMCSKLEQSQIAFAGSGDLTAVDFTQPAGEPALTCPDSISWQVFKNPVSLLIGGTTAVLLELAEPRVRSGVWDHTSFRTDPLPRMARTGLAAMVTVYGAKSVAEPMIAGVGRMHACANKRGHPGRPGLPGGRSRTARLGAGRATCAIEPGGRRGLSATVPGHASQIGTVADRLRLPGHHGAHAPRTRPATTAATPFRPRQCEILPPWARDILGLGPGYGLRSWERGLVALAGAAADRLVLTSAPPAQACLRMGLPASHLYRRG